VAGGGGAATQLDAITAGNGGADEMHEEGTALTLEELLSSDAPGHASEPARATDGDAQPPRKKRRRSRSTSSRNGGSRARGDSIASTLSRASTAGTASTAPGRGQGNPHAAIEGDRGLAAAPLDAAGSTAAAVASHVAALPSHSHAGQGATTQAAAPKRHKERSASVASSASLPVTAPASTQQPHAIATDAAPAGAMTAAAPAEPEVGGAADASVLDASAAADDGDDVPGSPALNRRERRRLRKLAKAAMAAAIATVGAEGEGAAGGAADGEGDGEGECEGGGEAAQASSAAVGDLARHLAAAAAAAPSAAVARAGAAGDGDADADMPVPEQHPTRVEEGCAGGEQRKQHKHHKKHK
jgi:hypothetical protein